MSRSRNTLEASCLRVKEAMARARVRAGTSVRAKPRARTSVQARV